MKLTLALFSILLLTGCDMLLTEFDNFNIIIENCTDNPVSIQISTEDRTYYISTSCYISDIPYGTTCNVNGRIYSNDTGEIIYRDSIILTSSKSNTLLVKVEEESITFISIAID